MFHVFLSAGVQPSALMGLIRGSDYESLQQALGPDCKSALVCDFFDAFACELYVWHRLCHVWEQFQNNHLDRDNMPQTEMQNSGFLSAGFVADSRSV